MRDLLTDIDAMTRGMRVGPTDDDDDTPNAQRKPLNQRGHGGDANPEEIISDAQDAKERAKAIRMLGRRSR